MSLLAGLGVDLLAQMLEFVDPANQLNFALSGLLQGLENINQVFPDSNMR